LYNTEFATAAEHDRVAMEGKMFSIDHWQPVIIQDDECRRGVAVVAFNLPKFRVFLKQFID
jgi:hypothetical protein